MQRQICALYGFQLGEQNKNKVKPADKHATHKLDITSSVILEKKIGLSVHDS